MCTVSVVIPAYNAAKTIGETIESVLAQSYADFELIVVDDGSTDETPTVVGQFRDPRIRLIRQRNQERSVARNNGIARARGKYIGFVDADDIWLPDKLARQVPLLDNNPQLGLVYSDVYYYDDETGVDRFRFSERLPLPRGWVWDRLVLFDCFIQSPTVLLRKEVFDAVGCFDPDLPPVEDWDMWLRVTARFQVDVVNEPLARYRWHRHATSWLNNADKMYKPSLAVMNKARLQEPALFRRLGRRGLRRVAAIHYTYGRFQLDRGSCVSSLGAFLSAIRAEPLYAHAYLGALHAGVRMLIGESKSARANR